MGTTATIDRPEANATKPKDPSTALRGRSSARRQQVLDAAAATFARMGYLGASTRAIADALGIKVASLYFHVASKEDALEEICALGVRRSIGYLDQALADTEDLSGRLRKFFDQQCDDLVAHADYVSVSIFEGRRLGPEARQRVEQFSSRFRAQIDAMFVNAAARGELHSDVTPRQARFILVATLRSISELYVTGAFPDFHVIRHAWVETIIRGLTRDGTAAS